MMSASNKSLVTFGHLEFLENVPFFVLLDYAISISFKKTVLYKNEKYQPFVKINIHLREEFL